MVKSQERLPYERAQGKVTITSDGKELVHMKKPNSKRNKLIIVIKTFEKSG